MRVYVWTATRTNANRPKALLKYYLISAALVLAAGLILGIYASRARLHLKIASVYASVPPKAAQGERRANASNNAYGMAAPWVLSALPECLRQTYEASGTPAYVGEHMPSGYVRVAAGGEFSFGDCSIRIASDKVLITRGRDRFYVPPRATLFQKDTSIALLYERGARAILRVYQPANAP